MKRLKRLGSILTVVVGVLAVAVLAGRLEAQDGKDEGTIKSIMQALHKSKTAALPAAKKALNATPPDWPAATKAADRLVQLSGEMVKLDPPKGDKANYAKLSEAYSASAKNLALASQKEDITAARESLSKLGNSCMACHRAHRPQ